MTLASKSRIFMYLAYVDDSGSTGTQLEDQQSRFQVLGGPIIHDIQFSDLELMLSLQVEEAVPENLWGSFEFHTCDLFNAHKPFEMLGVEKGRNLLKKALEQIREFKMPVVCGVVDKAKLKAAIYSSADPADIAFQLYLKSLRKQLEQLFVEKIQSSTGNSGLSPDDLMTYDTEGGIIIVDDGNPRIRHAVEKVFRQNRKRVRVFKNDETGGLWRYLMDDVYFGNSKNSLGIQLADVCSYFIGRHLAQKPDSEGFYNIIRDQVQFEVFP